MIRALGALLVLAIASGCQGIVGSGRGPCPIVPADVAQIAPGFRAQGTIRVADDEREMTLAFAVEREGDTLSLVGFTPFGTRAFAIVQTGSELRIDDFVGRRMGFEPVWLADALHRAFFVAAPADAREVAEGREWDRGAERVTERLGHDRAPESRSFRLAEAGSSEGVSVEYSRSVGASAEIDNPWCGYHARLDLVRAGRNASDGAVPGKE